MTDRKVLEAIESHDRELDTKATNREKYEKWFQKQLDTGYAFTSDEMITWWAWQAATKAERERCAKICDNNTMSWADQEWNSAVLDCVKKIRGE
jgi:hypothetical protein